MAEVVADALAPYVYQGVSIESTAIHINDARDEPTGPLRVRGYIPLDEDTEESCQAIEHALWPLSMIATHHSQPRFTPTYTPVADTDWANLWKDRYRPLRIGQRLMIVPAWLNPSLEPGDVEIRIEPGMAFGTGTHPTTQLCLAAIERLLQPRRGMLDLGCGSGILSIAALKLGAAHVWGYDIDEQAVKASAENVAMNAVDDRFTVRQGSVAQARASGPFALVVANILSKTILQLLDEGLADLVAAGGQLVVSGILREQAAEVEAAMARVGLRELHTDVQGDWVAIVGQR